MLKYILPQVAVDLGTVNTLIALKTEGIVLREPSAVALKGNRLLKAGTEALRMVGRTPEDLEIRYPLRDGVVTDTELCEGMLRFFLEEILPGHKRFFGVNMLLCLPLCVTEVEREALREAARRAGAARVEVMEEAVAAAMGAGLPVQQPVGSMIVDVGGGTTDAAVLSLGGVAAGCSVRAGGVHMDRAIMEHIERAYGLSIGERTAEEIKRSIASTEGTGKGRMQIRGQNRRNGLPQSVVISEEEIAEAIAPILTQIADAAVRALSRAPAELCADVYLRGIVLSGGSVCLKGLPERIQKETGMKVFLAEDPLSCVAIGALRKIGGELRNRPLKRRFSDPAAAQ